MTKYHKKYNLHGVTTIINGGSLALYVSALPYVDAYVITTEAKGTPKEHVHFYLTSDSSKLNISRFRKDTKENFNLVIERNGQFNIDKKVKNPEQCIIYLCKEGFPEYVHNFPTEYMKECSRKSYSKEVSMTTAIKRLQGLLLKEQLTPLGYTIEYRLIRQKYRKPDPHWHRQYENAHELMKSSEVIIAECNAYEKQRNENYEL